MAAGCASGEGRRRRGRRRSAFNIGAAILAGLALAACGQSMQTPLPDLSEKAEPPPGGRSPMSSAEQKKAIDGLIAKRDAMEQPQSK